MVPAAMDKTLRYLFLSTLLWVSLSCRPLAPVDSPVPAPLPIEVGTPEVVSLPETPQKDRPHPCVELCEHLRDLAASRPFSLEECGELCRQRSTPARNRCLLALDRFEEIHRCDY